MNQPSFLPVSRIGGSAARRGKRSGADGSKEEDRQWSSNEESTQRQQATDHPLASSSPQGTKPTPLLCATMDVPLLCCPSPSSRCRPTVRRLPNQLPPSSRSAVPGCLPFVASLMQHSHPAACRFDVEQRLGVTDLERSWCIRGRSGVIEGHPQGQMLGENCASLCRQPR